MNASKWLVLSCALWICPAFGAMHRLSFEGVVTFAEGGPHPGIAAGDAVSGHLLYDAAVPPHEIHGDLHHYHDVVSEFRIAIGGFQTGAPPGSFSFIAVSQAPTHDQMEISLGLADPYASFYTTLQLPFGSLNGSLPRALPPFSGEVSLGAGFYFDDPAHAGYVVMEWMDLSVTPAPEPQAWVFLIGGVTLLAIKTRKKRSTPCMRRSSMPSGSPP